MTVQSGGDLEWVRPNLPNEEDTIGDHRGRTEALNIRHAQPNFHYYYERAQASDILRRINEGYEVVQSDDPERFGAQLPEDIGIPQDGIRAFGDVVLVRCPLDRYRELLRERNELARAARESTTVSFLDQGHEVDEQLGHRRSTQGSYVVLPGHGTTVEEK